MRLRVSGWAGERVGWRVSERVGVVPARGWQGRAPKLLTLRTSAWAWARGFVTKLVTRVTKSVTGNLLTIRTFGACYRCYKNIWHVTKLAVTRLACKCLYKSMSYRERERLDIYILLLLQVLQAFLAFFQKLNLSAPTYTNLFMERWKCTFLVICRHIRAGGLFYTLKPRNSRNTQL